MARGFQLPAGKKLVPDPKHPGNMLLVDVAPGEKTAKAATGGKAKMAGSTKAGVMNKTESEYSRMLDERKREGTIKEWFYEAIKLNIGEPGRRCAFTVDFLVVLSSGGLEFHEVKGAWVQEDARVKFEAARRIYAGIGRWVFAQKKKNGWDVK